MENKNNKIVKIIVITICLVLMVVAVAIISTSGNRNSIVINENGNNNGKNSNTYSGDEKIETKLSKDESQTFFEYVPKIYIEEFSPFTDNFMLTAAMSKVQAEAVPDYSAIHVDNIVRELFGMDASINKENVSKIDIEKSLYYYYPDTDIYCIIPVGTEYMYRTQLLKMVTKLDSSIYVYTYEINGSWHEEDTKTVVVIGDKNGNDLVKSFETYAEAMDYSIWLKDSSSMLPVIKYTLSKTNDGYILTSVERINY